MLSGLTRRALARSALASAASTALPALAARAAATTIGYIWWGNPERDRRNAQALKLFQTQNPGLRITAQSAGWPDYWPKLAVMVAGGSAPDVIQMDYRYVVEYARRGALASLDELIPNPLNLFGFDSFETQGGMVGGKLYGVSVGANAFAVHYSVDAFQRAKVPAPQDNWTWDQFIEAAKAITEAGPKGFYGAADGSRQDDVLERFLRQHGKAYFTPELQVGFAPDDVAEFFDFWAKLRKQGIITPAAVTATDVADLTTSMLTTGKAAMAFHHSNQLPGVQGLMKTPVALACFPIVAPSAPNGNYLKPSQLMSIYRRSDNKKTAAELIRFMVADPQAVVIQGLEKGVPDSAALRDLLSPKLIPIDRQVLEYVDLVSKVAEQIPPAPPKGAGDINTLVPRIADKVAFGQISSKEAGQQFFDGVQQMVKRS
jgi:multiple sugar transport system substrate-binding protein